MQPHDDDIDRVRQQAMRCAARWDVAAIITYVIAISSILCSLLAQNALSVFYGFQYFGWTCGALGICFHFLGRFNHLDSRACAKQMWSIFFVLMTVASLSAYGFENAGVFDVLKGDLGENLFLIVGLSSVLVPPGIIAHDWLMNFKTNPRKPIDIYGSEIFQDNESDLPIVPSEAFSDHYEPNEDLVGETPQESGSENSYTTSGSSGRSGETYIILNPKETTFQDKKGTREGLGPQERKWGLEAMPPGFKRDDRGRRLSSIKLLHRLHRSESAGLADTPS